MTKKSPKKTYQEIQFVELSKMDIVRHPLVQKIIESYAKENNHG